MEYSEQPGKVTRTFEKGHSVPEGGDGGGLNQSGSSWW